MFLVLVGQDAVVQLVAETVGVALEKQPLVLRELFRGIDFQHAEHVFLGRERQLGNQLVVALDGDEEAALALHGLLRERQVGQLPGVGIQALVGATPYAAALVVQDIERAVDVEEHLGNQQADRVEVLQGGELLGQVEENVERDALQGGEVVGLVVVHLLMDAPGHRLQYLAVEHGRIVRGAKAQCRKLLGDVPGACHAKPPGCGFRIFHTRDRRRRQYAGLSRCGFRWAPGRSP